MISKRHQQCYQTRHLTIAGTSKTTYQALRQTQTPKIDKNMKKNRTRIISEFG